MPDNPDAYKVLTNESKLFNGNRGETRFLIHEPFLLLGWCIEMALEI
jgi:hypothetical protein